MRDIEADMKAALIDEYEGYLRARRTADADQVAEVLRSQYGHEVASKRSAAPERVDKEKMPEAAVEPKPRRGRPPRQDKAAQDDSKTS